MSEKPLVVYPDGLEHWDPHTCRQATINRICIHGHFRIEGRIYLLQKVSILIIASLSISLSLSLSLSLQLGK